MSDNAILGSESFFPNKIDELAMKSNFTAENINTYIANIKRLNELKNKSSLTTSEQTEMLNLLDTLSEFMISSNDWNQIAGSIINIEGALVNVDKKYLEHIEKLISITSNTTNVVLGNYTDSSGNVKEIVLDNNADIKITASENVPLIRDIDYSLSSDGKSISRLDNKQFCASEDDPLNLYVVIDRYITVSNDNA